MGRARRLVLQSLLLGAALLPAAVLGVWSFSKGWYWPALLPREWSLRAWSYVASPESGAREGLAAGAAIALAAAAMAVSAALPAARALALYDFRGKQAAVFALLLPILAPPLASAMGVHGLFLRYGLADTALGVLLVHLIPAAPYATLMLAGTFSRYNPDGEAVARTLGASPAAVWRHVTLPAIAPGLAVAAAFAFLVSWSQYLLTLLAGGGRVRTLPLYLVAFQRSGDDAVAAALALVFLAPALAAFAAAARFLRDNK
jgi:putative spermidine/putrescine transport system permease protein